MEKVKVGVLTERLENNWSVLNITMGGKKSVREKRWIGKEMMSDPFTQSDTCISYVLPGVSARCVCMSYPLPLYYLPFIVLCVCVYTSSRAKASSHPPPPISLVVQERAMGRWQDKFAVNTQPVNMASESWRWLIIQQHGTALIAPVAFREEHILGLRAAYQRRGDQRDVSEGGGGEGLRLMEQQTNSCVTSGPQ